MTTNPRQQAFESLLRFENGLRSESRLKADQVIADVLGKHAQSWAETERGFFHALVMGVLRHWFRLDAWIEQLTGHPLKNTAPPARILLRMGLFQLYGLNQVPPYAAINTTVELAKRHKQSPKTVKFINAVLREAQRRLEADGFASDSAADLPKTLRYQYGWPEAWAKQLLQQYEPQHVLDMAQAAQAPAPLTLRVNTLKMSVADYQDVLGKAGFTAHLIDSAFETPEALKLEAFSGSPRQLPGYGEGWFYVQDPASMWVSRLLNPKAGEYVLDLCAAPGSKTTHMAALMNNVGRISAIEPKAERLNLLKDNLVRLGAGNVEPILADGLQFEPSALFDKVLVDAPCSGSGTVRRHPEILLHLRKMNLKPYQEQQSALLQKGFEFLKPGGVLVYSTCSILQPENQGIVAQFLQAHPNARLESETQRLITENADGFYAARIQKS